MPVPIQEILMLLGDKVLQIHEKDKEIKALNQRIIELEDEAQRTGLRDASVGKDRTERDN